MSAADAADRELAWVKARAGAPRPIVLGCSTVSHDRLDFCAYCVRPPLTRADGFMLEANGWRLLEIIRRLE